MSNFAERIAKLSPEKRELLLRQLAQQKAKSGLLPPIQPQRREGNVFPLSFSQQRLWFLEQFNPDNAPYNELAALSLSGVLNFDALQQSINEIIRRHEILRTTFSLVNGQPVQLILPDLTLTLPVIELSHLAEQTQQERIRQLALEQTQQRFDLAQAPLLRVALLRLGDQEHIALITFPHIIFDGWSAGIFMQEMMRLYQSFVTGQPAYLPQLPIQYADFVQWQRQWMNSILEKKLSYWQQQLSGCEFVLNLPTDRPRPTVQTFPGARHLITLDEAVIQSLKTLSQQEGVTVFVTFLAAFKTLLYRYSGQADIVVGSPVANRKQIESERLIGLFLNTLVLRTNLSDTLTFRQLLNHVRQVAFEAYDHQDVPFEKLVEELQPERDMSRPPLFQVMFVLQNVPIPRLELSGLAIERLAIGNGTAKFDLTLELHEESEGIKGWFEYNTDLFDPSTIARMARHFQCLLAGIVANPDERLSTLPLMPAAERQKILQVWNDTKTDYGPQANLALHECFEAQVTRTPKAVAVIFEDQEQTYVQLNRHANQLAHYLQRLGVGPETRVGVFMTRSLEMVVALYAILKAGGAYVPLDPDYPPQRLAFMMSDAQVPVLLTQAARLAQLPNYEGQIVCVDQEWEVIAQESGENLYTKVSGANAAYVIYTSGSTGRPKGAVNTHQAIVNRLLWMQDAYHLTPADRVLQKTPFSFDVSVWEFFWPLLTGASLVVAQPEGHKDNAYLIDLITKAGITTLHFVPSMLHLFLQTPGVESCHTLQRVICSGEALSAQLRDSFYDRLESLLHNLYGPTEAAVDVTVWACQPNSTWHTVPIGQPIANCQIYVLDAHLQPVPTGVPGELHIGGVGLARGYHNRPGLTAEKFIPNPFSTEPGARLYKTGDLVCYREGGILEFLGRLDFQIKIRGFRVELGEIESVLNQHPAVGRAIVMAQEIANDKRLVGYLVPQEGAHIKRSALRDYLRARLPEQMVPASFVTLSAFPLLPNGKINRRALPLPDTSRPDLQEAFVAPRTPVEEMLAQIWKDLLALDQVGVHDNFFTLGGHSLLATQLVSHVRRTFQVDLPLRTIFEEPTIAGFVKAIQSRIQSKEPPVPRIVPASRSGDIPLSFSQSRLWFLDNLIPNNPFYNVPAAIQLTGPVQKDLLEQTVNEIVKRHEALRTTFSIGEAGPIQVIHPAVTIPIPLVELRELSEAKQEQAVQQLAIEEAQLTFNLTEGPLLRVKLLQLSAEKHILLLTTHHIVSDAWSMEVLIRETATIYRALSNGSPISLPDLAIQYADYAIWQRQWLQSDVWQKQLNYWKKQLEGTPPFLNLPTDKPRPPVQTFRGSTYSFTLPEHLHEELKALSQRQNVTLFMTLLASFQTLLYLYSGQKDFVVGTPIANRQWHEIEGVIGFFTNTLALRTNLEGAPTFQEVLERVREVTLSAYTHQDMPFEKLVEELDPQRDLSRTPVFQVMFVFQNLILPEIELPELSIKILEFESGISKFDLTLFIFETESGLKGKIEYSTDLFEAATIERMAEHIQKLIEGLVADPQRQLEDYSLLTATEKQLLTQWNETDVTFDEAPELVHELFTNQVARTPHAVAVTYQNQQLTYDELNQRANQLAYYLQGLGVGPDVPVAICIERSLDMVVAVLGILIAGGVYVPLDPTYPRERLTFMLSDAEATILLTQSHLRDILSAHHTHAVCLDVDWGEIATQPVTRPPVAVTKDHLAFILYTSGSTGKPKGVAMPHTPLINLIVWHGFTTKLTHPARTLQFATLNFDASFHEMFFTWHTGGTIVLIDELTRRDPLALLHFIDEQRVERIFLPFVALQQLAQTAGAPRAVIPSTLREIQTAGEQLQLTPDIKRFLVQLDNSPLHNHYGPTESHVVTALTLEENNLETWGRLSPIGRPLPNVRIYILNRRMNPVPIGVQGELYIGGLMLARGYIGRPDLSAERFLPDPFTREPGARMYKTGDLARYLPDGNIAFLGRADNQLKIRGYRVELGEIEAVLREHPAIAQAAAIVRETGMASDRKRIIAYVSFHEGKAIEYSKIRSFLKEKLPEYMVPTAFVVMDSLPLTLNGKINRRALPEPDYTRPDLGKAFTPPSTPLEKVLADIFAEVLELDQVGIHDNFFELGGHSLLATQVISRIREIFEIDLPLRSLFEEPTIAHTATVMLQNLSERKKIERSAKLMLLLSDLSDEEVESMLAAKKSSLK